MKHSEKSIIQYIQQKLSQNNSEASKKAAAFEFAKWFYDNYNHGLENQHHCAKIMMALTGLGDVCYQIQRPILTVKAAEYIQGIVNDRIYDLHSSISMNILSNLGRYKDKSQLSKQEKPMDIKSLISTHYSGKALDYTDVKGRSPLHPVTKAMYAFLQETQITKPMLHEHSHYGEKITYKSPNYLSNIKVASFANSGINTTDIVQFGCTLKKFNVNLDVLYLQNNPELGDTGVENFILSEYFANSLQYPVTHRIVHLNLSNCNLTDRSAKHLADYFSISLLGIKNMNLSGNNIGDPGAKIIADALARGKLSSAKVVDVSGNKL